MISSRFPTNFYPHLTNWVDTEIGKIYVDYNCQKYSAIYPFVERESEVVESCKIVGLIYSTS